MTERTSGADIVASALATVRAGALPTDMTLRQMAVLGILCDEPGLHRVRTLAKEIGAQKPVVTRILDRFEQMGIAQRLPDHDDRRDLFIVATAEGIELRAKLGKLAASQL